MESLDTIVKQVKSLVEAGTATRLILNAKGTLLKKEFLKKLFETAEKKDVSYDVLWLNGENEKIKIEDARRVSNFLSFSPSQAKHKYVISEEFINATPEAVAALLKITEEPPEFAVFIFFTSNPAQLLPTIRSRFTVFTLNVDAKGLVENKIVEKIKGTVLESLLGSPENALYISKNFESLKALFDESKDTFSTLKLIEEKVNHDEEISNFEISLLAERLFLFLKREEMVDVYQGIKGILNAKNSSMLFKAFLDAAIVIFQDLTILKKTSYWKGIKRVPYIEYYVDMSCPTREEMEWLLKVGNKEYYAKANADVGVFLLLSKLVMLKGK